MAAKVRMIPIPILNYEINQKIFNILTPSHLPLDVVKQLFLRVDMYFYQDGVVECIILCYHAVVCTPFVCVDN